MPQCKSCQAEVQYVPHERTGTLMIVDAAPAATGNLIIRDGKVSVLKKCDLFTANDEPVELGTPRYFDHHVTCPKAKDWRRPKK
jgi:hypothetical protein